MLISRREGSEERRVLIGMIMNDRVVGRIAVKWEGNNFRSRWANLIAMWCVDHYNEYGRALGKSIESRFETWLAGTKDEDTVALVEKFLDGLSREYSMQAEEINSDYVIDLASRLFNRIKIQRLGQAIESSLASNRLDEAINHVYGFNSTNLKAQAGINLTMNEKNTQSAFEEEHESLITYPGDLGRFFKHHLGRDSFISFMGPEKRGKSFWLLDIAYRGMLQRRRIAYFEAGDLSQNQVTRRFLCRIARHPIREGKYRYPIDLEKEQSAPMATTTLETRSVDRPLSWRIAQKACEELHRKRLKSDKPYLKLSVHPNSTLSVKGIEELLLKWERDEEWVPDVIVIDYADILAAPAGKLEYRDQINTTWKQLRSLSQARHCLVVTATQSDANSYDRETISRSNFSEDKRKLAHVTGLIGLNATGPEKAEGIMRLNWVVLREGEFSESRCVHVAGCLALANPAIRSVF